MFLMPTLILRFDKKIEKTAHRSFLPPLDGLGKLMYRIRIPVLAAAAFCAVPCYFGQSMNYFYYGDDALGSGPGTRVYEDSRAIEDVFGKSNVIIAMVPNGNVIKERRLTEELEEPGIYRLRPVHGWDSSTGDPGKLSAGNCYKAAPDRLLRQDPDLHGEQGGEQLLLPVQ